MEILLKIETPLNIRAQEYNLDFSNHQKIENSKDLNQLSQDQDAFTKRRTFSI